MIATKAIENIIYNKNKFNVGYWADEYIIKCNKHQRNTTLENIYLNIEKWVNKNNGMIKKVSECYISNDEKCYKIKLIFPTYNECKQVLAKV